MTVFLVWASLLDNILGWNGCPRYSFLDSNWWNEELNIWKGESQLWCIGLCTSVHLQFRFPWAQGLQGRVWLFCIWIVVVFSPTSCQEKHPFLWTSYSKLPWTRQVEEIMFIMQTVNLRYPVILCYLKPLLCYRLLKSCQTMLKQDKEKFQGHLRSFSSHKMRLYPELSSREAIIRCS